VARFGKEHVEPYIYEMEAAGAFKPELMQAIFDQGVSDYVCEFCSMCVFSKIVVRY
jgi:hypothetical protein